MTIDQAVEAIRTAFGDRDEHHPLCNSHKQMPCDCYAELRQFRHKALDLLVSKLAACEADSKRLVKRWRSQPRICVYSDEIYSECAAELEAIDERMKQ